MIHWTNEHNKLTGVITDRHYIELVNLAVKAALLAEKLQHHPTLTIEYSKLTIELSTHDAGNTVTEKDWDFAREFESGLN